MTVVGAGAIGSCFAVELFVTGRHRVTVVSRTPRACITIRTQNETNSYPLSVGTWPTDIGAQDWLVLATTTTQSVRAAAQFRPLIGTRTRILVLQNGIDARATLECCIPAGTVVECVVRCAAERLEDGSVLRRSAPELVVGDDPDGQAAAELFAGSRAVVQRTHDLRTEQWRKLSLNASSGPLTALTGRPLGVLNEPDIAAIAAQLIAECVATARACGAQLGSADAAAVLSEIRARPADATTSMLRALNHSEELEYDAITGAVVRAARAHGIPVPTMTVVHALLTAASR